MKRILTMFLILCVLISCAACGAEKDPAPSFFYLRSEDTIQYGQPDAMIAPVAREDTGDMSLEKMLRLYLNGPGEELYCSPFPKGTRLLRVTQEKNVLVLELSQEFSTLDSIQLTLAGACLAATCQSLAGYETIQVRSGANIYDFNLSEFVFLDEVSGK